jgi:thioesterase domain-containing protein
VDCVVDLVRAVRAEDPRPLVLAGASMGGMLAYAAAARTGMVDALAATCLLDPRLPQVRAAIARHRWLGRHSARLLVPVADNLRVPMRLLANMSAAVAPGHRWASCGHICDPFPFSNRRNSPPAPCGWFIPAPIDGHRFP